MPFHSPSQQCHSITLGNSEVRTLRKSARKTDPLASSCLIHPQSPEGKVATAFMLAVQHSVPRSILVDHNMLTCIGHMVDMLQKLLMPVSWYHRQIPSPLLAVAHIAVAH